MDIQTFFVALTLATLQPAPVAKVLKPNAISQTTFINTTPANKNQHHHSKLPRHTRIKHKNYRSH